MRFGRTRQSVIDPPKKRQKEFTDYGEYQRRLALYNDSTDAFQVSSNMEKYFDARLGSNPNVKTEEYTIADADKKYFGTVPAIEAFNMNDFLEFAKTPGNTLPKPKYKVPTGKRYSEDGLFYSANVALGKDNTVNVTDTDSERLYYENYRPENEKNKPLGMKLYDTPTGFVSNNKYELASEAAVRKGKTASTDGELYDYGYSPYGTSFIQVNKYAEPQVEPVFTGTPPSSTPPPRKQESIVSLPTKEYQFPRPNALELIDPMPQIYSRKLNQQSGEYIYETSEGTVRKKIGVEDARYQHQNRKAINAMRRNR